MSVITEPNISESGVLILAGGLSQRSGTIKGLRKFSEKYWLEQQIKYFCNLKVKFICIGLGFHYQEYFNSIPMLSKAYQDKSIFLDNTRLSVSINPNPENGMFSTLTNSLESLDSFSWNNLFLIHVDMALPKEKTLLDIFNYRDRSVVKPICNDSKRSGHPVLLSKDFCNSFKNLSSQDSQARLDYQINKLPTTEVYTILVNDPFIYINMNTHDEWNNYLNSVANILI